MLQRKCKEKERRRISIREEVYEGLHRGIRISYNGDLVESDEIGDLLILMEESDYMREFVADEKGKIIQVNYETINEM